MHVEFCTPEEGKQDEFTVKISKNNRFVRERS